MVILIFILTSPSFAAENKAYLKDGKIMIETPDGVNELDYSQKGKYGNRYSQKWSTRVEISPVQQALKVFQDKSKTYYNKRVWFIDKGDGTEKFFVEFTTDDQYDRPLFSPYYNYAYYLGYSDAGMKGVYGVNLSDNNTFFVDQGHQFDLVTCDDNEKESYIVVEQDGEIKKMIVYDHKGKKVDTSFDPESSIETIQKSLCQ